MIKTVMIWLTLGIATLLCGMATVGCTVIWTDDVFIGTLFKSVDANDIELIAEPNYLQIGSGHSKTSNDSVRIITPSVIIETGE